MRKLSFFTILAGALLGYLPLAAQSNSPSMDATMVQNGKIYVVVAVLVVIFIGILIFLIQMERRLRKLERNSQ
jgi:hypothetical protein